MTTRTLRRRTLLGLPAIGLLAVSGCSTKDGDDNEVDFPTTLPSDLSARQQRIVDILRAERSAQPGASKYTPVKGEPWCADFVSWVLREAGAPLTNPNSGGWRIPGTMTLRDHLRSTQAWHDGIEGYPPVTGDIAIYDGDPFGQHTNFVLSVVDGVMTTCGGNEYNRVRVSAHRLDAGLHCLGFGHRA